MEYMMTYGCAITGCSVNAHPYGGPAAPHKPRRGQGAMEYMMTYGWAILAVMVVGVAVWRLGILDIGKSTSPTSNGFSILKPILVNCKAGDNVIWYLTRRGAMCQFINNAGTEIKMSDFSLQLNGGDCLYTIIGNIPDRSTTYAGPVTQWVVSCSSGVCIKSACSNQQYPIGVKGWCDTSTINGPMSIPQDASFWMHVVTYGNNNDNCNKLVQGDAVEMTIKFNYTMDVGGVKSTKTESGTVHMTAT
jgi:hypothetical protein